jgi:phosphomannomutase/phosphoglucomutase
MLEVLSKNDKPFSKLYETENVYYSIPETKVKVTDDNKFMIVDYVLNYAKNKGYNLIDVDGVRVQFPDGWALVRASNTGPNLTVRYEATTEDRLNEIKNEFDPVINEAIEKM